MPQHKSAERRVKTSLKAQKRNTHFKSMMKNSIKRVRTAENQETAQTALKEILTLLDKLVNKRIIHKNKAANQKSRLTKFVTTMFKAGIQQAA